MKKILSLAFVFAFFNASLVAQSKNEKTVAAAVENLRQAMISGDRAALSNITAEALSYGHSSGLLEDKAKFVEAIASGKSDYIKIDLTEQTVKVVGKTAIVRHNLFAETNNSGTPNTIKLHVMTIWQKQSGQWKLLARQAAKVP